MSRPAGSKKVLLLVNADRSDHDRHSPKGERGPRRRTDFDALAEAFDADVIDWSAVRSSRLGRSLERFTSWHVAAAVLAFLRHRRYGLIWCMTEQEGSILALLFKLTRRRTPLMMVVVVPTSWFMWVMLRVLRAHSHITTLFSTSSFPLDTLRSSWGVPAAKLSLLPYQVDTDFFNEKWSDIEPGGVPYVLGVGQQARDDYDTLIAAVTGLPIKLVIAAGASGHPQKRALAHLPPGERVGHDAVTIRGSGTSTPGAPSWSSHSSRPTCNTASRPFKRLCPWERPSSSPAPAGKVTSSLTTRSSRLTAPGGPPRATLLATSSPIETIFMALPGCTSRRVTSSPCAALSRGFSATPRWRLSLVPKGEPSARRLSAWTAL